jgi:hypothetical protein
MRIDNAGNVGIGGNYAGSKLYVSGTYPQTSGSLLTICADGTIPSAATNVEMFRSSPTTQASTTITGLKHFIAYQGSLGAGSTVTNQYGFTADSTLTGATTNFGFYSNIASGTGRWNFYANGTADNYFGGNVGIGSTSLTQFNLRIATNITGNASSQAVRADGTVQSDVTADVGYFVTSAKTAAASFTVTDLNHFIAQQSTIGASSTVTNQYGFVVSSSLTGATNNYGFYGNIASGTNRWNLYMNGTAENYLGGNLKIGGTAARATTAGTNQLVLFNGTAPVGTLTNGVSFYSASGEARVMDAAGNSTLLSPHDSATNEWIFHSKHTPTGKVLRIDVEKMLRFINDHFGLDMIQEFTEE